MAFNNRLEIQGNFINDFDDDDNELSHHHRVPSIIDDIDWNDMTKIISAMDSEPGMSSVDLRKAQNAKKSVLSLRRKFIKENLIARAPYKGDRFYICSKTEFQRKAATFIEETGTYNFINEVSPTDPKVSQECLKKIMKQINTTLDDLLHSKSITDQQYILMHPKRSNLIRLNYLHFVPDLHKVCFLSFPFSKHITYFSVFYQNKHFYRKENLFNLLSSVNIVQLCILYVI
jgi:hypothetical protein